MQSQGAVCLSDLSAIADYCDSPNLAGREPIVQLSERQAGGCSGNWNVVRWPLCL